MIVKFVMLADSGITLVKNLVMLAKIPVVSTETNRHFSEFLTFFTNLRHSGFSSVAHATTLCPE